MTMTNEEHRELIRNMNAQADDLARHAENAGDSRAIVEVTTANTEALILLGRIMEPFSAKIVKALDAEQRERDEAEPKHKYCNGCSDCGLGHYDDLLPSCAHPSKTDNKTVATEFDKLPDKFPSDCPLVSEGDLLIIADTTTEKDSTE